MTINKNIKKTVSIILLGCFIFPLLATGQVNAETDWTSVSGSTTSPWISDAGSPAYENGLNVLWSNIGLIPSEDDMASEWQTPSTAISVGSFAYYYDDLAEQIKKVNVVDGTVLDSVTLAVTGMYNVPITYGDGRLFVPVLSGGSITVKIFDAEDLDYIGETNTPISKAQGMQGAVAFYEGYIYFGTYGSAASGVDFACFDEDGVYKWGIDGGSWSHAMVPQFVDFGATTYCIIASKGFGAGGTAGGTTVYVIDPITGSIYNSRKISAEFTLAGLAFYDGRVYVATQNEVATVTHIHSYALSESGTLSDEETWTSALTGGTQSAPVIYNDRIYLGSGGETMGPSRNVEVISIGDDGGMTSIYSVPIKTKSTLALTTAYATEANDHTVYLYCIPYNGLGNNPDVYIIEDSADQVVAKYRGIELEGEGDQFSYHSVGITSQGYLLIKNDKTLWCCEAEVLTFNVGDINCNEAVNIGDAVVLAQYLAHMMRLSDDQMVYADTNGNDLVNIGDAVRLAQYLAHYDVELGA